ncbi:hypothetical protein Y077_12520 [Salmonella enterica subsp. enterica serovar Infantis str. CVM N29304]|uniref:Uncharacterized protein n=1 Tax=Salmonella heidelberg (strain SL476) TaxID=454169 RepID=A0A6C6ZI77_SALHS|nr:hypothetical protein SeHA_C3919 [Salmonella enterica subsp. enterica serovar Heidelberg str. SL476]AGQ62422.1 hypothetical protein SEEH1578_04095 [Salmonella enterica subsp. enterica serovar Heidelberg str. 41578]AGQ80355.1 hypothetical protein CFSAN002069_14030 [Salmonella enterica subsp. enterica serovar Heidelberg str. CFSAN002069]AHB95454.1 hypothetical protein CFSAN002064_11335 [Salmonella enterica subsp. enterica serovar Heidelberg str. CFSAN002064]EDZ25589.1 hypothetical protein SeHB_
MPFSVTPRWQNEKLMFLVSNRSSYKFAIIKIKSLKCG